MASDEHDTNRLSSSAWGNATGRVDAATHGMHSATHNRLPILRPFVSRETCRRLQSPSIPAHTYVSLMTGEGSSANSNGGRLSGYGPAQPDTRHFSSGAVIPRVGVLRASKRRD